MLGKAHGARLDVVEQGGRVQVVQVGWTKRPAEMIVLPLTARWSLDTDLRGGVTVSHTADHLTLLALHSYFATALAGYGSRCRVSCANARSQAHTGHGHKRCFGCSPMTWHVR